MIIAEVYKGVPLIEGRTKVIVDTIIRKYDKCSLTEIANEFGYETFHVFAHIVKHLVANGYLKPKDHTGTTKPIKEFKPIKTAKNTFSNYFGTGKEKARDYIATAIMRTKRQSSNVLTLPAAKWIMEKNILEQKNGYKFTAVERDKKTFQKMFKNAAKDKLLLDSILGMENKSIGETIVNDVEDTYSSAILDYCGFIDSFYDEINDMLKRKLIKTGGVIAITLAENHRTIKNSAHNAKYSNKLVETCYPDGNYNGDLVTTDLIKNIIFNNVGYKLVTKFNYNDTTAKMLLYIIERVD